MKLNLKNTTFIIPLRFDSEQREFNFMYVLNYLCRTFETTIFLFESASENKLQTLLSKIKAPDGLVISPYDIAIPMIKEGETLIVYETEIKNGAFHRTRLLNKMLQKSQTHITVNYDVDIILHPEAYLEAQYEIINHGADLVYPYFNGLSQKRVIAPNDLDFNIFDYPAQLWQSVCGHCCFLKTESYRKGGMENEAFVSYAPEDSERMERFIKLGYNVKWLNNYVYHLEHPRGVDSSEKNPHFWDGFHLYKKLIALSGDELREYYSKQEYLKKYQ